VNRRPVLLVEQCIKAILLATCLIVTESLATTVCFDQASESLSWVEINIVGDGTQGPYPLGDPLIIKGTEQVWIDSLRLSSEQDYKINWIENQVTFREPLPLGKVVTVRFQSFSFPLQPVYRHRQIARVESCVTKRSRRPSAEPQRESTGKAIEHGQWEAFQVSGIKSLAVTVGSNRDLSLEQTLRLNISGRIGEDTEVLALVTDQDSHIQPEGNTERLQDLDKVLLQIKKDNLAVLLGDYDLSFTQTELGRYERKLQGICSRFSSPRFRATVAGALSRGEFTTNEFMGVEAKQGPYQLKAKDGNTNIVVVAGSEKVWLNGELLKRGENNDYTIEYGNGQITFTPHRLITSDSRITVDFEYSHQGYKRNSWSLRSEVNLWDNKARLGLTAVREGDDRKSPLAFALSKEEKELLGKIGDNSASAWISGVDSSAAGKGHYVALYDTLRGGKLYRYYQFDPQGQGDYNLSFSWVGEGGDYTYIGGGIYKYAGKGKGQYLPRRFLPLPTSHHIEVFDFTLNPLKAVSLSGEIGSSSVDLNTFSSRDDGDNLGRAYKLNASLHPSPITLWNKSLGSLRLSLRYRSIGKRFRPLGRISEVEEKYKWGISTDTATGTGLSQQEEKREISGSYHPTKQSVLNFEYGELERGDNIRTIGRRIDLRLEEKKAPRIGYHWDLLSPQGAGDILRQRGSIGWTLWKFIPEVYYESEFRSSSSGREGFQQIGGEVSLSSFGPLSCSSNYAKREEHLSGRRALAFTQQHRLQIRKWHSLTLNTEYSRRRKHFPGESAPKQRTDLADIDVRFSPFNGAVLAEAHYRLTSSGVTKKLRNYVYVGKTAGRYIWEDTNGNGQKDEGEFVPDPNGDYILYIEEIGESQPVTELDSGMRLAVEPRKALLQKSNSLWSKIVSELSSNTTLQLQRKTRRENGLNLWKPTQSAPAIMRDRSLFQQDISLFGRNRKLSLYIKHKRYIDLNNEYFSSSNRFSSIENSLKLRSHLLPRSTVEVGYIKERKARKGSGTSVNYRIDSHKLRAELFHRPAMSLEFSLRLQLGKDWEAERRTRATWISLAPGFCYRVRAKGRFRAQMSYTDVNSNKPTLIYQMAEGKRKGTNLRWNANLDYRFSQYASFSFAYYGIKRPERDTVHSLKAEMKAYF